MAAAPATGRSTPDWIRSLRDQATAAGVAFFKQWGGPTPTAGRRLLDGRTWDRFPSAVSGLRSTRSER